MASPRSDSPISRRIVLAFLDFLRSVELAEASESEAIEVASDCLKSAFGLDISSADQEVQPGMLFELFSSLDAYKHLGLRADPGVGTSSTQQNASCINSSLPVSGSNNPSTSSNTGRNDGSTDPGLSRDELFARFHAALVKINYFGNSPGGSEDTNTLANAAELFNIVLMETKKLRGNVSRVEDLAEYFKTKGNQFVQSGQYVDAIGMYGVAIALCENAVYFCNRAAAYTHLGQYAEAIEDCIESIRVDPRYSKAYSRLGSAYLALGNYHEALHQGYLKALELDPGNAFIQENIEVTKKKLAEQAQSQQNASTVHGPPGASLPPDFIANIVRGVMSGLGQQPSNHASGINNHGIHINSFVMDSIPLDPSTILDSFTANFRQDPMASGSSNNEGWTPFMSGPAAATSTDSAENVGSSVGRRQEGSSASAENGAHVHTNINLNLDSAEQVTDVLRSVMQMFAPQMNPQEQHPPESDRG